MSGGFNNPITGGSGILQYPQIESPNFVHGVSGWRIGKDGTAEFQALIIPPGSGGARIFVQAAAPASPNTGDLWVQTSSGDEVAQWSGSAWVSFQWGTGSIQANAITAALIAANTITAAQLAAGIIYAGIVDGTTITGAQIVADGTSGEILVYSGAPATGNLILSISGAAGSDSHSNPFVTGLESIDPSSGRYAQLNGSLLSFFSAAGGTFIVRAGSVYLTDALTAATFPTVTIDAPLAHTGSTGGRLIVSGPNNNNTAPQAQVIATDQAHFGIGTAAAFEAQSTLATGRVDVAPAATAPPARPAGTEPWNAATLSNSWANTAGRTAAQFRLIASPPASVEIIGGVTAPAGIVAGQTIFTLPAGYRLTDLQSVIAVNVTTGALVRFAATNAGAINYESGAAAGDVIDFHALISLDA